MNRKYVGPLQRGRTFRRRHPAALEPLRPGRAGTELEPKRYKWPTQIRHYPSIFRCWIHGRRAFDVPIVDYPALCRIMKLWQDTEQRRTLGLWPPRGLGYFERKWMKFLFLQENENVRTAWSRHNGRARRSMYNVSDIFEELLGPGASLLPWELANMQLPSSIACNTRVLYWHANMQGMTNNDARILLGLKRPIGKYQSKQGLRIFLSDRWVRFALVSPYVSPYGILMHDDLGRAMGRAEMLLERPYSATQGELDFIESSAEYERAWSVMLADLALWNRRILPPSGIFYPDEHGNIRRQPLYEWCWFQRGGWSHQKVKETTWVRPRAKSLSRRARG